jgi:hypothetical protein
MNRTSKTLNTLALLLITAAAGTSQATEVASWSLGCSNPTSVGSTGGASGRAGYDLKKSVKRGEADAPDCAAQDVKSPRDAATGQATGKRLHQPMVVTK